MSPSRASDGITPGGIAPDGAVSGLSRGAAELAHLIDPDRRLTVEQEAIVSAPLGPALVVAGAGSGKTETLSLRILYLLDNAPALFGRDISPDEILCLTFTRKATAEIAERAAKRIKTVYGDDPARPEVSVATYNGFAASLVVDHGLRVAVDPDSTVLTDAALWQLAASVVEQWDAAVETDSAISTVTAAIPRLAAQMRDHQVTTFRLREWAEVELARLEALPKKAGGGLPGTFTGELAAAVNKLRTLAALADLVEEFDRRKRAGSLLDFSDQIEIAVRLARLTHVQAVEAAKYRAVLLDEFQDTSPPQLELFSQLFGEGHPVMAVGDPNQAIYGFRGASAAALIRFEEAFGGRDKVARHTLSVSWRNEASILEAANATVTPLAAGPVVGAPLRSRGEELGIPEPSHTAPGVIAQRHATHEDEASAIVDFIAHRSEELQAANKGRRPTVAVLCRRRSQYSAIVAALATAGIAYEVVGLGGLLDEPEVADLLALLEVSHDPSRGDSLMRLLAGERLAIGPRDLIALHDWAEQLAGPRSEREGNASIVEALAELPPRDWVSRAGRPLGDTARERLSRLATTVDSIRRHTYLSLPELIAFADRAWGLDIEAAVARPQGKARRASDAFIDAARRFSAGAEHATLGAFLAWLEVARSEENGLEAPVREPDPTAVQLLTVHGAKGLEWDIVVVPGLNDGHFPSVTVPSGNDSTYRDLGWLGGIGRVPHELRLDGDRLPWWNNSAARDHKELLDSLVAYRANAGAYTLEEERRLFYVALTRARSHVLLTGSWFTGGVKPHPPSIYLNELLDLGVVVRGEWAEQPEHAPVANPSGLPGIWPPVATRAQLARRSLAARVRQAASQGRGEAGEPATSLSRTLRAMIDERAARRHREVTMPAHLSTSALVALRRDREAFAAHLRRPMPAEPTFAAHRGSALHAWIERHYGHTMLMDDDDLAAGILGPDERGDADLAALKLTFAASEWARRTPTAIEVDVELPVGGVTIRSRIDAVFPAGDGLERVTVVDWKSGQAPRDEEERAAREVQLAVYRLAWSSWKGLPLEDVDAAFYYVATDTTARPESLLNREEIEELLRG